jgi:hypothetical protein
MESVRERAAAALPQVFLCVNLPPVGLVLGLLSMYAHKSAHTELCLKPSASVHAFSI